VDISLDFSLSEVDLSLDISEEVLPEVEDEVVPAVDPAVEPVVDPSVPSMSLFEVVPLVLDVEEPPVSEPVVLVVFAKFWWLVVLLSLLQEKSIKLPETHIT
jgi:hypothetical protein